MKVVILAGGLGTRISEESRTKPKPMVEVGGMPILWHIMKIYSAAGYNEFIICAGYRQHLIKEFFADYFLRSSDVTFDFTEGKNDLVIHEGRAEPWKVTVVDTGPDTMTGGRVKRVKDYIDGKTFMLTYGDGLADIDLKSLTAFHRTHGRAVTISTCRTKQRFGILDVNEDGIVTQFREKPLSEGPLVNIGYMVCEPSFLDMIDGDSTVLEREPLERAAASGELMAYEHRGFWQCMDTLAEKEALEKLWIDGAAPWKVW